MRATLTRVNHVFPLERLSDPKPLITPPAVNKPAPKTKQQPMPPKILQELRQQKPNFGTSASE